MSDIPWYDQKQIDRLQSQVDQKQSLIKRLRGEADRASANAPGSFVTGRSGRSRAMNRRTEQALEKTINNAVAAGRLQEQINRLEMRIYRLQHAREIAAERKAEKERAAKLERIVKATEKSLPIINDPAAKYHMTSAEWAKIYKDYKGFVTHPSATYRYRSAIRNGCLTPVYLSDKKTVLPPKVEGPCPK